MIPHNKVVPHSSDADAVARTVMSGHWVQGPKVEALERELADTAQVSHAVCVGSGLAALRLALRALDVGTGDPVIVPAYSCVALPNAVLALGGRPLAVDVRAGDWNLDPDACRDVPAKAIIAVNMFGTAADVDALERIAPVIEDCSHAFGAAVGGRAFGGRSRVGIVSFYATKLVGGGEGGAVLTHDAGVAGIVREWRDYSEKEPDGTRLNDKMTDIAATLVSCQLRRLPEVLAERRRLARYYAAHLNGLALALPPESVERVWYRYPVECLNQSWQAAQGRLAERGVQTNRPVTPWGHHSSPIARRAYHSLLSIPLYPTLSESEQATVVAALRFVCAPDAA